MPDSQDSYGRILKSSSVIGAAAGINLILGMVRVKFAAVLIGTIGAGLLASFTAIQGLATSIFGLGLQSSAVRVLAGAIARQEPEVIGRSVVALRRICWLTGLAGVAAVAALSPIISQATFGTGKYALDISALGLVILFSNVSGGQMALIQGARRISDIARVNLFGALSATCAAVGFYGAFGIRGIVPALVTTAALQLAVSWRYAQRIPVPPASPTWGESMREAGGMVRLGVVFMWNGLLASAVAYTTVTVLTQQLDLHAAGLFSAAFALSGILVNFILGAMGADYYPSLTSAAEDPARVNRLVNEQTEIGLLLALPGLLATMTLAPWAIHIFYTREFLGAVPLLHWFVLGCFGRVLSWPLGFVMPALGRGRIFFLTETAGNLLHLALIVAGIHLLGLLGVAVAYFILYAVYVLTVLITAHALTGFKWSAGSLRLIAVSCAALAACFLAVKTLDLWPATLLGLLASIAAALYSLRQLAQRLGEDHGLTRLARRVFFIRIPAHAPDDARSDQQQ